MSAFPRSCVALVMVGVASAAAPVVPPAEAAATGTAAATAGGSGSSRLSLGGKGFKILRAQRVKLSASKPVRVSRTAFVLPVSTGALASTVRLDSRGALVMRRGGRTLKLAAPQVKLAKKGSRITAKAGKRRITVFTVTAARGKPMRVNDATGRATLQSAKVTLTKGAGRSIRRALRLKQTPAGSFGTVTVIATIKRGATGGGGLPDGVVPVAKPITNEPPLLARPATARDITGATVNWDVRESLIRYINTGEGTAVAGGATASPPEVRPGANGQAYTYQFQYVQPTGWYDAASGKAALYFKGLVNFKYSANGIDFDAKDVEVEINGSESRVIFRLDGRRSTNYGNKRSVLIDLDSSVCSLAAGGGTCTRMPGTVPQSATGTFAGFYPAGAEFGNVSATFTAP